MLSNKQWITIRHHNQRLVGLYETKPSAETLLILFHGFTGTKTEAHYNFKHISEALIKENIATLRFDFLGSGESDGHFNEQTKHVLKDQLESIVTYAKSLNYNRLVCLGFSMSGLLLLESLEAAMNRVILINPALNMAEILTDLYRSKTPILEENVDLDGLLLSREVVESFQETINLEPLKKYLNPILIFHSINDATVPIKYSEELVKSGLNIQLIKLDSNHTLSHYEVVQGLIKSIITFIQK